MSEGREHDTSRPSQTYYGVGTLLCIRKDPRETTEVVQLAMQIKILSENILIRIDRRSAKVEPQILDRMQIMNLACMMPSQSHEMAATVER